MSSTPNYRLHKYKHRPCYYVLWNESGKTKSISTGTQDETEAKRFLADFVVYETSPKKNLQTIADLLDHYEKWKIQDMQAKNLHKNNEVRLRSHLSCLKRELGDLSYDLMDRHQSREYTKKELAKGIKSGTIRTRLAYLTAAFNHAKNDKLISEVPTIDLPPPGSPRDTYLTPHEVQTFIRATGETHHLRLFVMLALHTLARRGAILELTWDRVDLKRKRIDYSVPGRATVNKRRVPVPINDVLFEELKYARRIAKTNYVIEYQGNKVLDIKTAMIRAAKDAKDIKKVPSPVRKKVTAHVLRHTGATLMAQAGVSLFEIAGLMGDTLETVTKHYAHHCPDYLKTSSDKLAELYRK